MSTPQKPKRVVEVRPCSLLDAGTDAIVNASNSSATLGGGVSRAIYDECGGEVLQNEMREKLEAELDGVLEEDDCLVTSAGTSKRFRFILHVQAVDYRKPRGSSSPGGPTSPAKITRATAAALRATSLLATADGISVAFPLLGAGSGGLSAQASTNAMVDGLRSYFREEPDAPIRLVLFAVPEPEKFAVCKQLVSSRLTLA